MPPPTNSDSTLPVYGSGHKESVMSENVGEP